VKSLMHASGVNGRPVECGRDNTMIVVEHINIDPVVGNGRFGQPCPIGADSVGKGSPTPSNGAVGGKSERRIWQVTI
jgi:hypothetical protein